MNQWKIKRKNNMMLKSGSKSSDTDDFKDNDDLQVKDIEYTKLKLDELKDTRVFNPVTKPWQLR